MKDFFIDFKEKKLNNTNKKTLARVKHIFDEI
jgi:hypothetical protein